MKRGRAEKVFSLGAANLYFQAGGGWKQERGQRRKADVSGRSQIIELM